MATSVVNTNPALTNPPMTPALCKQILAGAVTVEPRIAAAWRTAELTGQAYSCPFCHGHNDGVLRIQSHGMGVESSSISFEWFYNTAARDFCLCQLIVILAETGDEHEDTITAMETYILPLLRYYGVRLVEVARGGPRMDDGIVVLGDSRAPRHLHPEGFYKLSDHLKATGTVPFSSGTHLCAIRFKSEVIEYWLTHCLRMNGFLHTFGYSADEPRRVVKSRAGIAARNGELERRAGARREKLPRVLVRCEAEPAEPEYVKIIFGYNREEKVRALRSDAAYAARNAEVKLAFGYNSQEQGRADGAAKWDLATRMCFGYNVSEGGRAVRTTGHDTLQRIGFYPLIEWQWTRQQAADAIVARIGVSWERSACVACPFNCEAKHATPRAVARFKANVAKTADGLLVEYGSLCTNERGLLYVTKSLNTIVVSTEQEAALAHFEQVLATIRWSVIEVKRVFSGAGTADRSIVRLAVGTRTEMQALFAQHVAALGLKVKEAHGIKYGVFAEPAYTEEQTVDGQRGRKKRIKAAMMFPALEGFLVVAPAHIEPKVRSGMFARFEERFAATARQLGLPLPLTPGTALVQQGQDQAGLFDAQRAA